MVSALAPILARVAALADDEARRALGPEALEPRALAAAALRLSDRYTRERSSRLGERDDGGARAARVGFFLAADAPKVAVPLDELARAGALPPRPRVLDLGCGAGATSLGAAALYEARGLGPAAALTLCDRDRWMVERARALHQAAFGVAAEVRVADVARGLGAEGPFDLVLAGALLNELGDDGARARLVEAALASLAPGGALVLVEPALRDCARALHRLRDGLLARGAARVFAPCLHGGPCPLLRRERDWCHEERAVALPPALRERALRSGLRTDGLKFAYLTLRRRDDPRVTLAPADAFRVVSGPLDGKGRAERLLCGTPGLVRAARLGRHRTPVNAPFDELARGDVVALELTGDRVGPDAPVVRLLPADAWSGPPAPDRPRRGAPADER